MFDCLWENWNELDCLCGNWSEMIVCVRGKVRGKCCGRVYVSPKPLNWVSTSSLSSLRWGVSGGGTQKVLKTPCSHQPSYPFDCRS